MTCSVQSREKRLRDISPWPCLAFLPGPAWLLAKFSNIFSLPCMCMYLNIKSKNYVEKGLISTLFQIKSDFSVMLSDVALSIIACSASRLFLSVCAVCVCVCVCVCACVLHAPVAFYALAPCECPLLSARVNTYFAVECRVSTVPGSFLRPVFRSFETKRP